jgi:hypothetical protein
LRWFSNLGNGPAHPLQGQPLGRPPEVRGPSGYARVGVPGNYTSQGRQPPRSNPSACQLLLQDMTDNRRRRG